MGRDPFSGKYCESRELDIKDISSQINPYDICAVLNDPAKRAIEVAPTEVFMFVLSRGVLSLTDMARMTTGKKLRNDLPAQWLCLFLTRAVFSKGRKFDLCESYPRIIPRIIPPNHTPKNHDYECFFWDRLGLHWPH